MKAPRQQQQLRIIDDCFSSEYICNLRDLFISPNFEWSFIPWEGKEKEIENLNVDITNYWFTHNFYANGEVQNAEHWHTIQPLLTKLREQEDMETLLRLKANLYPCTPAHIVQHNLHRDFTFSHTAAILSLNTCDGYTTLANGTEIDSVANQIILFDGGMDHCSSSTTTAKARLNIIVNYLP